MLVMEAGRYPPTAGGGLAHGRDLPRYGPHQKLSDDGGRPFAEFLAAEFRNGRIGQYVARGGQPDDECTHQSDSL